MISGQGNNTGFDNLPFLLSSSRVVLVLVAFRSTCANWEQCYDPGQARTENDPSDANEKNPFLKYTPRHSSSRTSGEERNSENSKR
uniref:Secreted protein n=1 Tax=Syphacia muris TaxID=451379 RepID=A0A0N5AYG7_9BILA